MKKLISLVIVFSLLSSTVFATSSMQQQLNSTKNDITQTKKDLQKVQNNKKLTLNDIEDLDQKIGAAETDIAYLENEISTLETNIETAIVDIKEAEEEYEIKDVRRQDRLIAYYKCGSVSLMDTLLQSESVTDFFFRYRVLDEIMEYDQEMLEELNEEKEAIENKKTQLEENKVVCEQKKVLAEEQKVALNDVKEIRVTYLGKLEKEEDLLEKSIDELQKKADSLTEEIKKMSSSSATSKYTGGTMQWPLPNYYTVTSYFGNRLHPVLKVYKMHTGVDIAGSGCNGKNVVAAADGKVITAGWISGYGYTVMIDHGGGVVTLYAHSQKLLVKVGDKVTKGQAIMLVGSTGYATGPHLHFEVRINGKYVNPLDGYISAK